jgi:hopene-associated glycosyltransferase HpnB
MDIFFLTGAFISLLCWLYLAMGRGHFWRAQPQLPFLFPEDAESHSLPSVAVVIPARNEEEALVHTLPTLLEQTYEGGFHIFLVDDHSTDGTADRARQIGEELQKSKRLTVISGKTLPSQWTGKLWALNQGLQTAQYQMKPDFFLFTDADIAHHRLSLKALVNKAMTENRNMVSVMVRLKVASKWEHLLIPSFVYFFSKLYPFKWVNDSGKKTAAAAGGCILVRAETLIHTGGLKPIASELIDDCALARQIKGASDNSPIWLGLSDKFHSIRHYEGLKGVWDMVSRTAYTELRYSPFLLLFTVLAMATLYVMPPLSVIAFIVQIVMNFEITRGGFLSALGGACAWGVMAGTFIPLVRFYKSPSFFAFLLPVSGLLYTLMTIDSTIKHIKGKGGQWKGRTYS